MTQEPLPDKPPPPVKRIDPTFRNGSVTAIGVVLAFSLGFLNNWASIQAPWITEDLVATILIAGGIALQIWALAGMLSTRSLEAPVYRRIVRIFLIGLTLVALGVLLAISGDASNYLNRMWRRP